MKKDYPTMFERILREVARNPSLMLMAWVVIIAGAIVPLLLRGDFAKEIANSITLRFVLSGVTGLVLFSVLLTYLQPRSKNAPNSLDILVLRQKIDELQRQSAKLDAALADALSAKTGLTEDDKQKLIAALESKISSEAVSQLFDRVSAQLNDQIKLKSISELIDDMYGDTTTRLKDELSSLGQRGNLNLIIGIMTTVAGLLVLGYVVFKAEHTTNDPTLVASYYLPRLSLVLFIEIFAFFFLRLYKSSLGEIKYFQNELTNIESKFSALRVALKQEDAAVKHRVIDALCQTERNYLLKAGETTAELELAKINRAAFSDVTKGLTEIIQKLKKA